MTEGDNDRERTSEHVRRRRRADRGSRGEGKEGRGRDRQTDRRKGERGTS